MLQGCLILLLISRSRQESSQISQTEKAANNSHRIYLRYNPHKCQSKHSLYGCMLYPAYAETNQMLTQNQSHADIKCSLTGNNYVLCDASTC